MAILAGDYLIRAVMTGSTVLPEDTYINDFAFQFDGGATVPTTSQLDDVFNAVDGFYNDVQAGGDKVASYLGEAINRSTTHELQAIKISTGGSPVYTDTWLGPDSPAAANTNLPTEVAATVSFHADLTGVLEEVGSTRPKARRRGRLYVGPLTTQAVTVTDDNPRLSAGMTQVLRQAIIAMADEAALSDWVFCVWSRVDATLRPAVGGWTDNAPDTQRRRGIAASIRTAYTI